MDQTKSINPNIPDLKHGKLTLDRIKKYHEDLKKGKIDKKKHSPILLPDYRREEIGMWGFLRGLGRLDFS